jgi:hypothetical protein
MNPYPRESTVPLDHLLENDAPEKSTSGAFVRDPETDVWAAFVSDHKCLSQSTRTIRATRVIDRNQGGGRLSRIPQECGG